MRSPADRDEYCVEIQVPLAPGEWRKGSGYLIGPCRILTSLHVLVGDEAVKRGDAVSAPDRIEVRAYGDFADRFVKSNVALGRYVEHILSSAQDDDYLWRPATLRWPRNGAAMPRYDLAILEVKPEEALRGRVTNAPRIICTKPTKDLWCRGTGFPKWAAEKSEAGEVSSPRPVTGVLSFGPATARGYHSFTAKNGAPRDSEEWKRISGRAFFQNDTEMLVGVASALESTADNTGLWVTQLADLAAGDEFREFWAAAGMRRPNERSAQAGSERLQFPIDPLSYLHEFDRTKPEERVLDVFDPLTNESDRGSVAAAATAHADGTQAPPIFLIAGRRMDLPDEMVKRIRQIVLEYIGDRNGGADPLTWRYRNEADSPENYNPKRVVALLRAELAHSLRAERPRAVASLDSLCDRALGRDWSLIINVEKATDEDADALGEFFAEFAKLGRSPQPPSLFVTIVPGAATLPVDQHQLVTKFIERVRHHSAGLADRTLIIDGIYLQDCEFEDIQLWAQKSLGQHCEKTAQQCRILLEQEFSSGSYALGEVRDTLSAAMGG